MKRWRTLGNVMLSVAEPFGFALLAYAAWEIERVAGIAVAGLVLIGYGALKGRV